MHSPSVRIVLGRTLVTGIAGGSVSALMPIVVRDLLHGGAQTYGVMLRGVIDGFNSRSESVAAVGFARFCPRPRQVAHRSFVVISCPLRGQLSGRKLVAEHGQAADRLFLRDFVLDDIPVLGQQAVLETHDIHHNPVRR
jgi:hypothetical protein